MTRYQEHQTVDEDVTLYTDSPFQIEKENKLKGMALECLIKWTFSQLGSSPIENERSLINISREASKYLSNVYRIAKNFSLIDADGLTTSFSITTGKEADEILLDLNLKNNYRYLLMREKTKKVLTRYKEVWDGKWSVCSNCKKFALTEWLQGKKKKCWKCREGFFRKNTKKEKTVREVETTIPVKAHFETYEKLKEFLMKEKFISRVKVGEIESKRRADMWRMIEGKLYIYESKNKEKTQLQYKDIIQPLVYGIILKKANLLTKKIDVIFNGTWNDNFLSATHRWFKVYQLEVDLTPVKKWLSEFTKISKKTITHLLFTPYVIPDQRFHHIKAGSNSKWYLNILYSDTTTTPDYAKIELTIREKETEINKILVDL